MTKLIIGYGPAASGKSTAAFAWKREDWDHRLIIEEGDFRPATIDKHVMPQLDAGNDVWMNIITSSNASTLSLEIEGYEVEVRKFERRETRGLKGLLLESFGKIPPITRVTRKVEPR